MSAGVGRGTAAPRVVAVAPHLDDAVLSLGATLAHLARAGCDVVVLTVLAGASPGSPQEERRAEDARACAAVGARPCWLPLPDDGTPKDPRLVGAALAPVLRPADVVLAPGYPLEHPDHAVVARAVADLHPPVLGHYVEQPYAAWAALRPGAAAGAHRAWTGRRLTAPSCAGGPFVAQPSCGRCRLRKLRAVSAYGSQLRVLRRLPRTRIALYELLARGEQVSAPPGGSVGADVLSALRAGTYRCADHARTAR